MSSIGFSKILGIGSNNGINIHLICKYPVYVWKVNKMIRIQAYKYILN